MSDQEKNDTETIDTKDPLDPSIAKICWTSSAITSEGEASASAETEEVQGLSTESYNGYEELDYPPHTYELSTLKSSLASSIHSATKELSGPLRGLAAAFLIDFQRLGKEGAVPLSPDWGALSRLCSIEHHRGVSISEDLRCERTQVPDKSLIPPSGPALVWAETIMEETDESAE